MRILHTSDWHLGRALYGKRRYAEHAAFLAWLIKTVEEEQIDLLVVTGDIFDSSTPGNASQQLYYSFLEDARKAGCRHIVITAGNHDSPTFLDAPQGLLRSLSVHVVGEAPADPADCVLVLHNEAGQPECIVAAVPYLRDRDIRNIDAGESLEDKERKFFEGIAAYYTATGNAIEQIQSAHLSPLPAIVTGHLFAAGSHAVEGDGMRDLYVGSLVHVPASIFPACADYVALGHLHSAQCLGGNEKIRYSGAPVSFSFEEAMREKSVAIVNVTEANVVVALKTVPVFRRMVRVEGDLCSICARLQTLVAEQVSAWVEVLYTGADVAGDLREQVEKACAGSQLDLVRIRNQRQTEALTMQADEQQSLEDLTPNDVFEYCLDARQVPEEQRTALKACYQEILQAVYEAGTGEKGQGDV